ncbi:molybdopterin-synthase adenylyltransferase MoeB [Aestuariibacter halophilus]|uniref:Molybdopterin-synthase adenylyltransferase MoeB n=1 Tax=Fluctibacter halophilus TaxID=226011 RepID=A0ABS8G5U5_9ALTE|nr:molybdopterin-synthase adenylyltransferase MoeB [Aestuariibacter halophilus]MCC2615054.1 molybdopterin-synthase adenylyltransferase MoeB [Aestuariibacter halophilus]
MNEHENRTLSQQQALRYCRQILLPGFDLDGQEALLNARVLQIGVGGLGCAAAQYLVASGIGNLTLVDDDTVALTNLQRQILHTEQDLGKLKCESAKQSLTSLNSDVDIQIHTVRMSEPELEQAVAANDIVLDCTDNLETRNLLNTVCWKNQKALISGAAIRMEGQISSFVPQHHTPCYQCLSRFFGEQNLSCVESGIMSPVVGIIGAMQALEAIKLLTGFGEPLTAKVLLFDAIRSEWQTFALQKDPQCPVCGTENGH